MVAVELRGRVLQYLAEHQVMSLATATEHDIWAAAVFYVNKEFDFFFLSAGHTRHAQNMGLNPRVAATIQEDYRDWPQIKGVQMEGEIALLTGVAQRAALALYQMKYPFLQSAGAGVQTALARVNWYRLRARRLYFIDNSRGLGHRDEVDLGPAQD